MQKFFGTDGVRGRAGETITAQLACTIGAALATILYRESGERPRIMIGRDTRISGTMLEQALAGGICAGGGEALLLGVIPTPAVSGLVRAENAQAGVVISASHNPFDDNGIKIFGADGRKFDDAKEAEIEAYLRGEKQLPALTGGDIGFVTAYPGGAAHYMQTLLRRFPLDLSGLKLVVDTAHGATSDFAATLFEQLGATVVAMFHRYDGLNINENCGSTKPEAMAKAVRTHGADLGVAYDGDGDRLILADREGNLIDGDRILALLAVYLKDKGELAEDLLVVTVMSNMGLRLAMQEHGIRIADTKVGDKHVMAEMDRQGGVLGGEQSGHIILSRYNPTGDGMLTSLLVLQVMRETGKSLAELAAVMTPLPQINVAVRVSRRDEWQSDPAVQAAVQDAEQRLQPKGRILIRPSGTEPVLRVMGEGEDELVLRQAIDRLVTVIEKALK